VRGWEATTGLRHRDKSRIPQPVPPKVTAESGAFPAVLSARPALRLPHPAMSCRLRTWRNPVKVMYIRGRALNEKYVRVRYINITSWPWCHACAALIVPTSTGMKKPRHSRYPISVDDRDELASELEQFGAARPTRPIGATSIRSRSGMRLSCMSSRCCMRATISAMPWRCSPPRRNVGHAAATPCVSASACSTAWPPCSA
jgi:hypothetical protein